MARRVALEHRGERIVVEYRPELFEDARFRALVDQVLIRNDVHLHARALSLLLASWSVARGGRAVPITEDVIVELPLDLTAAIVRAIGDDGGRMKVTGQLGAPLPWVPRPKKRS